MKSQIRRIGGWIALACGMLFVGLLVLELLRSESRPIAKLEPAGNQQSWLGTIDLHLADFIESSHSAKLGLSYEILMPRSSTGAVDSFVVLGPSIKDRFAVDRYCDDTARCDVGAQISVDESTAGVRRNKLTGVMTHEIPVRVVRTPMAYPFDTYEVDLGAVGCVNCARSIVPSDAPSWGIFDHIRAVSNDPSFVVDVVQRDASSAALLIERPAFIKVFTIYALLFAIVFCGFSIFEESEAEFMKKSLGLFAGLWGLRNLVVTKAVDTFPTYVDFVILLLVAVLFTAAVFNLIRGNQS